MKERNVGTKGKSPKQGLTSANDLPNSININMYKYCSFLIPYFITIRAFKYREFVVIKVHQYYGFSTSMIVRRQLTDIELIV